MGTARFYRYWEDKNLVTLLPENPDVLASIYAHDDKLWLVVGNWTDTEQTVNAKLNLTKTSPHLNSATATIKNIWKDGTVTNDGEYYHFSVPPKSARIIEIGNQ
jgi:5-keto 4-deoxyuronate isomerase